MATFLAAVLLLQACLLAAAWEASPISGHSSGGQHLPTMRHAHHPGGWPVDGQHRAGGRTLDPPHLRPLRQSAVQRAVIEKVVRAAVVDSPAATARVLAFLDSPAFRAGLRQCCPEVATLMAAALYDRFKAEVGTMEMVHNWDPRPNGSPFDELNLTTWLNASYDYNLWEMSFLGLREASFLSNCDLAEVGLMGFPRFNGVPEGTGALPKTFAEAADRPTYTALNLWRNSMGNPKFGPVSVVFSPAYVADLTLMLPVDSGLWESSCNRSSHWGNRMNCSAWNRTESKPLLGTIAVYDHLSASWLSPSGIWQPAYPHSIPSRLFQRLFGDEIMPLTEQEGVSGQLYWEAQIAGNVLFPEGVKLLVGQFDQLFGTPTGLLLQQLAQKNGWALAWALGAWNATGSGRHHWPGRGGGAEQLYNFSGRLLDPTALAHTTAGRNLTVPAATAATFSQFWAKVATARASIMPAAQWPRLWLSLQEVLPRVLRLDALRAGSCARASACLGVNGDGHCVCYTQ